MGFVDLTEGPDGLRARAVQFAGQAEGLAERLHSLLEQIESIEAARPWGGDKYGNTFAEGYGQPTEEGPFNEAVDAQVRGLGPEATQIGTALTAGATDYLIGDLQAADDIGSLAPGRGIVPGGRAH
ncbi:hypothetical protein [Cryptosporangium minutisporangium]|uniref:WXG100 family type VII secretion target n=1 Tax=Cryptosporangium minutisporangium TaxID=113569 RepID=A0ABP6TC59_9ACTN